MKPFLTSAAEDPRLIEVELDWTPPRQLLPQARAAALKRPGDARAWRVLAGALAGSDASADERAERLRAMARAVKLEPNDVETLRAWAWALIQEGKPAEAVPLAERAASLDPDPAVLDTLAIGLTEVHRCADALYVERRALELVPPEQAYARRALANNFAQIQQQCAGK